MPTFNTLSRWSPVLQVRSELEKAEKMLRQSAAEVLAAAQVVCATCTGAGDSLLDGRWGTNDTANCRTRASLAQNPGPDCWLGLSLDGRWAAKRTATGPDSAIQYSPSLLPLGVWPSHSHSASIKDS